MSAVAGLPALPPPIKLDPLVNASQSPDPAVCALATEGYVVIPDLLAPAQVKSVRQRLEPLVRDQPPGRNAFEGRATRRVYGLLAKTRALDDLIEHPRILEVVSHWVSHPLLSAALLAELQPGEVAQPWHADGEFYRLPRPHAAVGVSTILALDDFTSQNGATCVLPRSHLTGDERPAPEVAGVPLTMPAGSVGLFLDTVFHRAGSNGSLAARLGLTVQYCQGWARTIENMFLAVPRSIVRTLSPRLQALLGYEIVPPFIGYADGRHPRKYLEPK